VTSLKRKKSKLSCKCTILDMYKTIVTPLKKKKKK
jgi:hypothetical protein